MFNGSVLLLSFSILCHMVWYHISADELSVSMVPFWDLFLRCLKRLVTRRLHRKFLLPFIHAIDNLTVTNWTWKRISFHLVYISELRVLDEEITDVLSYSWAFADPNLHFPLFYICAKYMCCQSIVSLYALDLYLLQWGGKETYKPQHLHSGLLSQCKMLFIQCLTWCP